MSKKQKISVIAIILSSIIFSIGISLVASSGYRNARTAENVYDSNAWLDEHEAEEYRKHGDYYSARLYDNFAKNSRNYAAEYHKKCSTRLTFSVVFCIVGSITGIIFAVILVKEKKRKEENNTIVDIHGNRSGRMKAFLFVALLIIVGILIFLIIYACDQSNQPYIPYRTYAADEQKEYNAADLTENDMKNIAEAYIKSNDGKYWINMWYNGTVENIRIASYDRYMKSSDSNDGTTEVHITAHGTFSVYDKYGNFVNSHDFDYRIRISGTFTSSYIKDIAKNARCEDLIIDGKQVL